MKIALVSPYDWCVEGGVKTHIAHLAEYFREWGHEVVIFAPASDPEKVAGQCEVMGKPWSMRVNGSVARITFAWKSPEVKAVMAREAFDILHLHEPLMPLLPYHFLRYSNCVTIGTFHAAKEGGNRFYSYTKPITRPWFRKLDGKIAVAHAAANLVSRYFPGYFNIIPNGIDYEHFRQEREPLPEFMDGRPNILFVGRPEKRKGLKYLLRAFILIKEQVPDARLIVVGAGDFSRYERLIETKDDVVFRSYIPYDELPRYHRSASVFCAPNTGGESQGYVLLEAMASGMPVVASNIEGFAGVITDELEGLLVRPKDPKAIAAGIMRVLRTPGPSREMGKRGQAQAAHYSWDNVARRVMAYYERLMYEHQQVADSVAQRQALPAVSE
ncbi:glycosyltransferase family 4 protein [bacterium]|jgi:phosphatidylinositol alpha-mannosyltransferase|nr:glycosyltransferase family 4 protein [bacterium]